MEGLKQRAMFAVGLMLLSGGVISLTQRSTSDPKTEEWMLANTPKSFGSFNMLGGSESSEYTYKMDEVTYQTLDPYGIVARVYEDPETKQRYDVVIIASRSKDSFHDPRVCFSAQGWALANQWSDVAETETRGSIPVTIALMDGPDERNKMSAFLYRGPGGEFYASTQRLKVAMFLEQLKGGQDLDGVFYRFIPQHRDVDQTQMLIDMKRFIAQYMDKAYEVSDGYF